jgi:hypothetical protein
MRIAILMLIGMVTDHYGIEFPKSAFLITFGLFVAVAAIQDFIEICLYFRSHK